jgi:hypothetical protein
MKITGAVIGDKLALINLLLKYLFRYFCST